MKKVSVKWIIMPLAIIVSVCGAFATRPHFDCTNSVQYYKSGSSYIQAGTMGLNYTCTTGIGACTYYTTDGIHYFQCQVGVYCTNNCFVRDNEKPTKTKSEPGSTTVPAAH
jgi:hypothetical protein